MKLKKKAFTLVELLVVIVVIAILSMMIFKLMGYGARSSGKAQTMAVLLAISQALEEFKAAYGIYPPVNNGNVRDNNVFQHPLPGIIQPPDNKAAIEDYFEKNPDVMTPQVYRYGLFFYLFDPRCGFNMQNPPNPWGKMKQCKKLFSRDVEIRGRWQKYLSDTIPGSFFQYDQGDFVNMSSVGLFMSFPLHIEGIYDSWRNYIYYECLPPYQTYKLYSAGPDGAYGTADDIHGTMKWDTK